MKEDATMKTWYHCEPNGNLLTLQAEREPSWFISGNRWEESASAAFAKARAILGNEMKEAESKARDAASRLGAFDAATRGRDRLL